MLMSAWAEAPSPSRIPDFFKLPSPGPKKAELQLDRILAEISEEWKTLEEAPAAQDAPASPPPSAPITPAAETEPLPCSPLLLVAQPGLFGEGMGSTTMASPAPMPARAMAGRSVERSERPLDFSALGSPAPPTLLARRQDAQQPWLSAVSRAFDEAVGAFEAKDPIDGMDGMKQVFRTICDEIVRKCRSRLVRRESAWLEEEARLIQEEADGAALWRLPLAVEAEASPVLLPRKRSALGELEKSAYEAPASQPPPCPAKAGALLPAKTRRRR